MRLVGVLLYTTPERFGPMREFYLRLLGDHLRSDRRLFVSFSWGEMRLTVTTHSQLEGPNQTPQRIMLNLGVDQIENTLALIPQAPLIRPPQPEPWGGRVATVADPDGNYLQFLELPKE